MLAAFEFAGFQILAEALDRSDEFATGGAPVSPGRVKALNFFDQVLIVHRATLIQKATHSILVGEIALRGVDDGGRRTKTNTLPFQAAFDRPSENTRPFRLELLCKLGVAFALRDRDSEG